MMNRKIYIYILSDPKTNEVRYVGRTIQKNPKDRLSAHISQVRKNRKTCHCQSWIKSLLDKNLKPIFTIIEETNDFNRESYWINYYINNKCNLTNHNIGGLGADLEAKFKRNNSLFSNFCNKNTKKLYMWDLYGNLLKIFDSYKKARDEVNEGRTIYTNMKTPRIFKNKYIFTYSDFIPEKLKVKLKYVS